VCTCESARKKSGSDVEGRGGLASTPAMTEKGFRIASEVNKEGWEKAQFPILCETCLGAECQKCWDWRRQPVVGDV